VKAYQLLKRGLKEVYGMEDNPHFIYNEHGKPSIEGHPEIFFNLSHCKEAAICAISDRPIGVDVESVRAFNDSLVRYTMNDDEVREIETADDRAVAFIRLWTKKEAALKLTGDGLTDDLPSLFTNGLKDQVKFETHICKDKGYVYSICHYNSTPPHPSGSQLSF
jgi:4'-phosphopantetheinyl transferase